MTSPNIGATAQSVADKLDGIDVNGPLGYREVDQLAELEIFGLATTAPDPEAPNQPTTSGLDILTTLGKIGTSTYRASDGKVYNAFDGWATILEVALELKAWLAMQAAS